MTPIIFGVTRGAPADRVLCPECSRIQRSEELLIIERARTDLRRALETCEKVDTRGARRRLRALRQEMRSAIRALDDLRHEFRSTP